MASRSSRPGSEVVGAIVISIFALGIGAIGVACLVSSFHKTDRMGMAIGSIFATIGVGLIVAAFFYVRYSRRQRALEAAEPDKPWMWNSDWASGSVPDHAVGGALGSWIFTAVWNAVTLPSIFMAQREFHRHRDPAVLLALVFPGIGLFLLGLSIRATLRAKRFGASIFQLQTLPAVVGHTLAGTIRVPRPFQRDQKIRLHLTCTQTIRSAGNNNSSRSLIWEDEQEVDHLAVARDQTDIPVCFAIPRNSLSTSLSGARAQVVWQLEAAGKMHGIDYLSRFKVPIFRVSSPSSDAAVIDASVTPWLVVPEPTHAVGPAHEPAEHRGISLSPLANGGCTLYFAAARNPAMVVFLALMGIAFTAGAALLPLPWLPIAVLWLFAIPLDIAFLNALLGSAIITAGPDGLSIDRGLPLCRFRRDLTAQSISEITMQMKTTMGDTAYYTLQAVTDDKTFTIVGGIKGKPTAKWLSAELERSLGLKSQQDSGAEELAR